MKQQMTILLMFAGIALTVYKKYWLIGNGIKLSGQMPKTSLILKSERSFYFSH